MRHASWLFLVPLLLAIGCARPEVEAFRQRPTPVRVSVTLPTGIADREAFEKEYASALRARLATRVVVVPEGVAVPAGASNLEVYVQDLSPAPGQPSPAAVGVAAGVTVGILSAASNHHHHGWSVLDGLFWGLWAGTHAAAHQERTRDRLGYHPQAVRAQVRLMQPGNPEPLWVDSVSPVEVVEAMDPLPPGSRDDEGRIREEEAKGFARVVVQKLSSYFHLTRSVDQQFYEDPSVRKEDAPAPKSDAPPEPKKD